MCAQPNPVFAARYVISAWAPMIVLPRRHVSGLMVAGLLLSQPLASLVVPRTERVVFVLGMSWLLISVPLAVVSMNDWSQGAANTNTSRSHGLLRRAARLPAALLAIIAVAMGVGSAAHRAWEEPRLWRNGIFFAAPMFILGHGLWRAAFGRSENVRDNRDDKQE